MVYRFAEYRVDPSAQILLKHGTPVSLSAPCFLILQTLLEQPGVAVSRNHLLDLIDRSGTGDPGQLEQVLAELHRALDETGGAPRIDEAPEGGVRFLGTVASEDPEDTGQGSSPLRNLPPQEGNELFRLQHPPSRRSHVHWVVAFLLLAGLAVVLYLGHRSAPEPLPVILSTRQLTQNGHEKATLQLSPHGAVAWYTEQDRGLQLWRLSLATGETHRLEPAPMGESLEDVSADGKWLLVRRTSSGKEKGGQPAGLWQTDRNGGNARLLVADGWSGAWSPNGRRLAYSRMDDHGVYLANADGSHAHRIAQIPGYPRYLTWAPEGDRVVMASVAEPAATQSFPEGRLYRVYTATGGVGPVKDDTGNPIEGATPLFGSDHRHILFTHTAGKVANIWEVDRQNGHLLSVTSNRVNTRLVAVGPASNQIIIARASLHARLLQWQEASHHLEPFPAPIETRDLAFSPDGKWIAYVDLEGALWQARVDGSHPIRLLAAKWKASEPAWAPDSRQLVVAAAPQGGLPKLYRLPAMDESADSSANAITSGMGMDQAASWAPDGKHVLFCRTVSGVSQLHWLNLDSGTLAAVSDSRGKCSSAISPQMMLAATDDAGQALLIRHGINGQWRRILVTPDGVHHMQWSHDGRSLYFLAGGSSRRSDDATHGQWKRYDLKSGRMTTVADLGPVSEWATGPWHSLALTAADGLVISFDISGSEFYLLTLGSDE